ncbi:MAG: hypothetical protein [Caudoviricetes sp.]|nr:MAG: hypothetical protein [Caudoviricetes sp.]
MAALSKRTKFRVQEFRRGAFYVQRKRGFWAACVLGSDWYDVSDVHSTEKAAWETLRAYINRTLGYPKNTTPKTVDEVLNAKS